MKEYFIMIKLETNVSIEDLEVSLVKLGENYSGFEVVKIEECK